MYIYLNGKVVSKDEAMISPYDHGFMYGLGAFETFRTYDGFPFLIQEHLNRLSEALDELNINDVVSVYIDEPITSADSEKLTFTAKEITVFNEE